MGVGMHPGRPGGSGARVVTPEILERDGARFVPAVLGAGASDRLRTILSSLLDKAGTRLRGVSGLAPFLTPDGPVGAVAARWLGPAAMPVRAVLFDKTPAANWALGWHQDRTIAVENQVEVEGFSPWSRKGGLLHVAPPMAVLERMVTLRIHLDDVGRENAPLLVALGSHRLGRIPVAEIGQVVANSAVLACLAQAGDVWVYATPIVHASDAAETPVRRRVLQVDYANFDLPGGLEWLGV